MPRNASARFAALLSASLLVAPAAVQAQKALVYCPVGIDASGCNAIVTALNASPSPFPGGVDGGYDGSQGTVDLATADLSGYAVFVVPSLADGAGTQPYGLLRDATIAARLAGGVHGTRGGVVGDTGRGLDESEREGWVDSKPGELGEAGLRRDPWSRRRCVPGQLGRRGGAVRVAWDRSRACRCRRTRRFSSTRTWTY